jgi:hypothetical protein
MEKHRDFPAGNFNGDHFRGHRLERPLPFTLFSMEIVIMRFRHIYGGNHPEAWELTCREQDAIALQLFGATRLPP